MTNEAPILSLIGKQAHREACTEIDPKFQTSLSSDCLQIFGRISANETRRFALFTFSRNESGENAFKLERDTTRRAA